MIPASQERLFLRSLALSLSSGPWRRWWWLPKSVASTENFPARGLWYPMSPSSSGALPP
uniref:Uncharacterized protein n=1 Tax=Triticum urartu TaxID=4572 RepID=A0A8R7UTD3_TRIUA